MLTALGVGRIGSLVKRKKQPNVAIDPGAHKQLKKFCAANGLIARTYVSALIRKHAKETKPE